MSSPKKALVAAQHMCLARRWHRRLAIAFSVYLIVACLGALAHQLPRYLGSQPFKGGTRFSSPPVDPRRAVISPAQAQAALGLRGQSLGLRLLSLDNAVYYQADPGSGQAPRYVDAETGRVDSAADARLARALAGPTLDDGRWVEAYEPAYPAGSGPLPVWAFKVAGPFAPVLYIDTKAGAAVRKSDALRRWTHPLFRQLHMLDFVPGKGFRDGLLGVLALALLVVGAGGLWLAWLTRRRAQVP